MRHAGLCVCLLVASSFAVATMRAAAAPPSATAAPASAQALLCAAKPYDVQTSSAVYGSDTTFEALDIYTPAGLTSAPVIVFVHGGGWTRGDKSQYRALGQAFAACGIAFIATNYPLAPQMRADGQAAAVAHAIKWTLDNAAAKSYAPGKVFLMGHAAGAQLATLAAVNAKVLAGAGVPAGGIAGVIALDGNGYNPSAEASDAASNPGRYRPYSNAFGADPSQWKQYDIAQFLVGKEPHFLIVHGVDDYLAEESDSGRLVDQLRHAHDNVTYLQPEERDQNGVLVNLARTPDDPTLVAIQHFVLGK